MARKVRKIPPNYNKPFPARLRESLDDTRRTRQELADHLGLSRQAVGYYCLGTSAPDWETLAAIADFFNISADWLIGLSDVRQRDPEIEAVIAEKDAIITDLQIRIENVRIVLDHDVEEIDYD